MASLGSRIRGWFGNKAEAVKTTARRSVFKGAELSRLMFDWVASAISADQELYNDFLRLRSRARELARNSPLVRQYLQLLAVNVVGSAGFQLQAQVRNANGEFAAALNKKIEAGWLDWSQVVTTDCMMGLADLSKHLIRNLATDGEILVRKIRSYADNKYRFALQQIDPDLLDHQFFRQPNDGQNEIRLGVEVNQWNRPVAYWFWDRHPTDLLNISARRRIRVPADEVIHLYLPDRANQTRGTSWLNSVMMPLKMLDGYVEAELVAARTGAAKMGFFQWKSSEDFEPPTAGEQMQIDASPGTFEQLAPGLEFKEWNPDHPSTAFPNFYKAIVRQIASGLGVNYNALANDLEGVNYSSMRSGLLIERDMWRSLQALWINRFLMPIYLEWLDMAILSGELVLDNRNPKLFQAVKFLPRGWAWVDPLKDVNADVAAINNGLESRGRVLAEQGVDFEELVEELAREQKMLTDSGVILTGLGIGGGAAAADVGQTAQEKEDAEQQDGRSLHVISGTRASRAAEHHLNKALIED